MPTRMLREGILDSDRVNRLDDEEEVFYRRLMSIVDDYGRFEAQRAKLRARLYPLKLDSKSENRVGDLLLACVRERLVLVYAANGKAFLQLLNFAQQTRSKSKCPPPDDKQLRAFAMQLLSPADMAKCLADAQQLITNAHLGVFVFGDVVVDEVVVVSPGGGAADAAQDDDFSPKRRKPKDVAAVIAFAATRAVSEVEARKFFDYNHTRKWRAVAAAGGDWRLLLKQWLQRKAEGFGEAAKKNNSDDGAAFNSKALHAHTGGLPVLN